jgi:hypothetical protein
MCFTMCGVWLNLNIIQHTHTPSTTIAHQMVKVLVEFWFGWFIEFDNMT